MRRIIAVSLWISLMVLVPVGCRGNNDGQEEPLLDEAIHMSEEVGPTDPLMGDISDGHYSNPFFGINMTFPEGWHQLTAEELRIIEATGSTIAESVSEVSSLVAVTARPLDQQDVFNPSLLLNTYQTLYDRNEDLMVLMEDMEIDLASMEIGFDFDEPEKKTYFDGVEGVELRMSLPVNESIIYQTFFVAVVDGWLLEVTATYSESEKVLMDDMLSR